MLRALLTTSFGLQYVVLPLAGPVVVCAIAYWRMRGRDSIPARATRWAVVAAVLACLACTLAIVQQIAVSGSSTAFLEVVNIGPAGSMTAAVAFVATWAFCVVGQWAFAPARRRPGDSSSVAVAWLVVVAIGGACATLGYSAHLQRIATRDASPATLRDVSHGWWTVRDAAVREALASNPRTPPDVLAELAWEPALRPLVAANPATPPTQLERMYVDPASREGLAENPSTPDQVLHQLATAPTSSIRWALVRNPAVPDDVLADLERDPEVGAWAARAIRRRAEGRRWHLLAPPYTWRWYRPFTRVLDDAAPENDWQGIGTFDTEAACEALRTEYVRRETHRAQPVRADAEFPADFYQHTRCALALR